MSERKKRKSSQKSSKTSKRGKKGPKSDETKAPASLINMDQEWDKIDHLFKQCYRKESDRICEQVVNKAKETGQWFENCPNCSEKGTSCYRGHASLLQCSKKHFWWPGSSTLVEKSVKESLEFKGCDEAQYYGEWFVTLKQQQMAAKAQVLRDQAQALETLSRGSIPTCIQGLPVVDEFAL